MLRLGTGYVMCSSNDQMKIEVELNALMPSILSKAFAGELQMEERDALMTYIVDKFLLRPQYL
jgi:hypothetical protein